jgi:diaminohydroxyphosphoribosylaminopyrimidine deaminase/5-amino-6-(5-phosphoribosylamino)uracil reductase
LEAAGGRVVSIPVANGHLDLSALLDWLGREGGREGNPLQSLLVEAGPGLATALWAQDLVDRYFVFIASKLVGGGVSTLHNLGIDKMDDALTFAEQTWERVGEDLLFRGYRRALG